MIGISYSNTIFGRFSNRSTNVIIDILAKDDLSDSTSFVNYNNNKFIESLPIK